MATLGREPLPRATEIIGRVGGVFQGRLDQRPVVEARPRIGLPPVAHLGMVQASPRLLVNRVAGANISSQA